MKSYDRLSIVLSIGVLIAAGALLVGCAGFQGHVYERMADDGIGPAISGVEIVFTKKDGSVTKQAVTDDKGWYRRKLEKGRYHVTATQLIREPYDSAPDFFVVVGGGYQTGNIFLHRLDGTVVILVRHAEKASSDVNTNLDLDPGNSGIGVNRAESLAALVKNASVAVIFATEWCRTAQTAQPSAQLLGLPLQVIPAAHPSAGLDECEPAITVPIQMLPTDTNSAALLAQHVVNNYAGQVVLIVGHSNTVPQLIKAFGAPPVCPTYLPTGSGGFCVIPDSEFNHLFIVNVPEDGQPASVRHRTYGAP